MSGQHILLVNDDPELVKSFQKTLEKSGTGITTIPSTKTLDSHLSKKTYSMVIVAPKNGSREDLRGVINKNHPNDHILIMAPSHLIKPGIGKIRDLLHEIRKDGKKPHPLPSPSSSQRDISLNDFVERKLKDFVKRIAAGRGRNLYSLLIKEIEKPLITMVLQETKGNQVQAAQLLGVNRNTLRKKIKDLKITIKKTKK